MLHYAVDCDITDKQVVTVKEHRALTVEPQT